MILRDVLESRNGFAPRAALLTAPGATNHSSESSDFYLFSEAVRTFTGLLKKSSV